MIDIILYVLGIIGSFALGYNYSKVRPIKYNGWKIEQWKGIINKSYYFIAERDEQELILKLNENGDIDIYGSRKSKKCDKCR